MPSDTIATWGYQVKNVGYLNEYCLDGMQPSAAEYQGIRSLKYSAELPEAKYRFTLAKEVYESESGALKRERTILEPMERNSKQAKLCNIRKIIRINNTVYLVHTDVGVFRKELQAIFDKLVTYLSQ